MLVTGAGPIGLLAALMGVQRGLDVHVFDRVDDGTEARARARPRRAPITPAGSPTLETSRPTSSSSAPARRRSSLDVMSAQRAGGHRLPRRRVVAAATASRSTSATLNRDMVLENDVVFGSVNANRRHYEAAAAALAQADRAWLDAPDHAARAARSLAARRSSAQPDDVKVGRRFRTALTIDAGRIEDYALIGDCETAALVVARRLDRLALLAALRLAAPASPRCSATPEHGRWLIAPAGDEPRRSRRRYRERHADPRDAISRRAERRGHADRLHAAARRTQLGRRAPRASASAAAWRCAWSWSCASTTARSVPWVTRLR